MLFSSAIYLAVFLPLTVLGYRALRAAGFTAAAQWLLVAASFVFYAWADVRFVPLLLVSLLANYAFGRIITAGQGPARKRTLVIALVFNIGLLAGFKYLGFLTGSLHALGLPIPVAKESAFPLGLSFFTIQQVMYVVDCYERLVKPNSLRQHSVFVAFFPYLLLGPISRAKSTVPQFDTGDPARFSTAFALSLLLLGLAKKVIIADSLAVVVNRAYAGVGPWTSVQAWVVSVAYSLQLYFDFSGYTDMAIASAMFLGVEIPRNFNVPFRSKSVTEFWQRWHITLTNFITTYLFTPLLRSFGRATMLKAASATFIAMVIAGLWHGPSWTFVLFGALHGLALGVNQYWKRSKRRLSPLAASLCTLLFLNVAFVVFRAPDLSAAGHVLAGLIPVRGVGWAVDGRPSLPSLTWVLPLIVGAGLLAWYGPDATGTARQLEQSRYRPLVLVLLAAVSAVFLTSEGQAQFLYTQF